MRENEEATDAAFVPEKGVEAEAGGDAAGSSEEESEYEEYTDSEEEEDGPMLKPVSLSLSTSVSMRVYAYLSSE